MGGYSGSLSNTGEQLRLELPDAPPLDDPNFTPVVTVDEVIYDDRGDWPEPMVGEAIFRRSGVFFGNDGASWTHKSSFDFGDQVFGDFTGDQVADVNDLELLVQAAGCRINLTRCLRMERIRADLNRNLPRLLRVILHHTTKILPILRHPLGPEPGLLSAVTDRHCGQEPQSGRPYVSPGWSDESDSESSRNPGWAAAR